jgi:ketosteroid isomerase-like protein
MEPVERLLIEWECTKLVNAFAHAIDHLNYDQLVLLFTEDGIFDRVGQVLTGRDAIREAMQNRHALLTRHVCTNIHFSDVDRDDAKATLYVANFVGTSNEGLPPVSYELPQPALLEFDDVYRRSKDGWRIAHRTARVIIMPSKAGH